MADVTQVLSQIGQGECLHAKYVVVDNKALFVSLANFAEAAQERNIEVGLLVRPT